MRSDGYGEKFVGGTIRTASKVRKCDACGENIKIGQQYRRVALIGDDGKIRAVVNHMP